MRLARTWVASALVAAAFTACGGADVELDIKLVKPSDCGQGPNPLEAVTYVRTRLLDPTRKVLSEDVSDRSAGEILLKDIPAGIQLRLEVAGFEGAPPSGRLVSWGVSAPFRVSEEGNPPRVIVHLRQVERFSPVVLAENPRQRVELAAARAGHSATLLSDGRVLFAGGFAGGSRDASAWTYLENAEIFDPIEGTLEPAAPMGARRAFHTATRLSDGRVLLAGGEAQTPDSPVASVLLFDSAADGGRGAWRSGPTPARPRTRHTAALETRSRLLLFGGLTGSGATALASAYEWLEPNAASFTQAASPVVPGRVAHASLKVAGDRYVVVAGGAIATATSPKLAGSDGTAGVQFLQYKEDLKSVIAVASSGLSVPRSWPAAAALGSNRIVILGGFQGFTPSNPGDLFPGGPTGTSDVVTFPSAASSPGPALSVARGQMCAAGLADGRALAIGGRSADGSSAAATVFTDGTPVAATDVGSLAEARYFHTCTPLQDGTVLVAGGLLDASGQVTTLKSLEIYTPRPAAD